MVDAVNGSGYQAYSYQQAASPLQNTPRGGENRIEARSAPAGDSNKGDSRELASRDNNAAAPAPRASNDDARGNVVDVVV